MKKANEKGPELLAIWRQMMEKNSYLNLNSQRQKSKISWIKVIASDAELAKYILSNEERSEYNKLLTILMRADFKALVPELPLILSLQKSSDKLRIKSSFQKSVSEGIRTNILFQQPTGKLFLQD